VSAIDDARRSAGRARQARRDLAARLTTIERELASVMRVGGGRRAEELGAARRQLIDQLAAARTGEARAAAVRDRLIEAALKRDVAADIASLDARVPLVLLPVRLETRFFPAGDGFELRVRIYPDSIVGDTHEPALTDAELRDGQTYWQAAWDAVHELTAWRTLVANRSAARAAWIVQTLTPTNLASRPSESPSFPTLASRTHTWSRPGEARLLPERWLVVAYSGGTEIARGESTRPVAEPLVLTYAPDEADAPTTRLGQTLEIDDALAWAFDFERAEAAGMAVRLHVAAAAAADGVDVYCVGVKMTLPPAVAADAFGDLLDAHRFSRGLALVPQGTATNNTSAGRAVDLAAAADASFRIARGAPLVSPDSDGSHLAQVLGVTSARFDQVEFADGHEQRRARAMNNALWPATLGYYLEQMMAPVFGADDVRWARRWFVDHVRGRGPAPAFRIGGTPYGVLPATALAHWPTDVEALDHTRRQLPHGLRRLRPLWAAAISRVPAVRPGTDPTADPDADLLGVLAMDASAREVWIRHVLGHDTMWSLGGLFGLPAGWLDPRRAIARQILQALGRTDWDPRILAMVFDGDVKRFMPPLVSERVDDRPLEPDYIAGLLHGGWIHRLLRVFRDDVDEPKALLYRMLRYAIHREVDAAAFPILLAERRVQIADRREPELVGIVPNTQARLTMGQRLSAKVATVSGTATLAEHLWRPGVMQTMLGLPTVRESIGELVGVAGAELERLFTETLDACSYRIDAWITSLATARLRELRAQAEEQPTNYIGAFGWVERVRPRSLSPEIAPNLGFVHAPSMDHATAAAILRNAWGSTTGDNRSRYAVDLSSHRVRLASDVLTAVREGQPLGAVLGYRFERALHDARLDVYKEPFRQLYPLPFHRRDAATEPVESIAARHVVDGYALRKAYRDGTIPWARLRIGTRPLAQTQLEQLLAELDDIVDAVADLVLCEAVYQIVRGNPAGAQSTFEAIVGGARPPEPDIIRQPRGGTPLTHRVGVVIGSRAGDGGWPATGGARSALEPALDAWLATRLGPADDATLEITWLEPQPSDPPLPRTRSLRVADLGLRPLDLIAVLRGETQSGQDSELDRRAAWAARTAGTPRPPADAALAISYAPATVHSARTAADLFELARRWSEVLAHVRALVPTDLLPPEEASAAAAADLLSSEAAARVATALDAVADLIVRLPGAIAAAESATDGTPFTQLRSLLRRAADVGVVGAYPRTVEGIDPDSIVQARAALAELSRREAAVAALPLTASVIDRLAAGYGPGMLFLPRFIPHRGELDAAIAAGAAIGAEPRMVARWFQQAARVQPALSRWRTAELLSEVRGAPPARFTVAQLPHEAGARWVGLEFGEAYRPPPGRVSLVLHRATTPAADEPWCGFWLDEWAELIPNARETTGVAFHYDAPNAEAPQAILVAVAPPGHEHWSTSLVLDTLRETLELAKIRGVDAERLELLGQLLPATFFATNSDDEALRFDFVADVMVALRGAR
jgi:hypothetical protein